MLGNEKGGQSPPSDSHKKRAAATAGGAPTQWPNANQANERAKAHGDSNSNNFKFNWQKGAEDRHHLSKRGINISDSQWQNSLKFHPPSTLERKEKRADERSHHPRDDGDHDEEEKRTFLVSQSHKARAGIKLAKQESLLSEGAEGEEEEDGRCSWLSPLTCCCCCCSCFSCASEDQKSEEEEAKMCRGRRRFWLCPLLLVLVYSVAIYCLPFVDINPRVPEPLPNIPFNFNDGPLRPSTASQFKAEQLFRGQIFGAESLAFDSSGNAYMAIEGGFILYAHLNKSSPFKTHYWPGQAQQQQQQKWPQLVKIAELNGVKQVSRQQSVRSQRSEQAAQLHYQEPSSTWRRECQLDEQLYGQQLFSPTNGELLAGQRSASGAEDNPRPRSSSEQHKFVSHVKVSRCSKPLGTRLSPDESFLYVVDTLNGLHKVHLKVAERAHSTQRLVTRLVDFRANNWHQTLPAVQLDTITPAGEPITVTRLMNVSLRAVDDLTIDYGAGTKGGDMIYLTIASQQWPAVSFVYDNLEGRPSGLVARFDTGSNQLVILEPNQLAHVRTSGYGLRVDGVDFRTRDNQSETPSLATAMKYGVPRLDENDVFDDRPLHFPNGVELMDDKQALLIADTSNKRIIKYYIRGPRRGTSDLWAYTPNYPDNIRRGYDKRYETYWVVGCGKSHRAPAEQSAKVRSVQEKDLFAYLRGWPAVKKFALKNIYFLGWFIEKLGQHLLMSEEIRDYGYELKMGSSLCQNGCTGMMVLQFNQNGDLIRSIHSPEFPNDLKYYSQVNELIDAQNQQHSLYLSSPSYNYVTKLILPTESYASTASLSTFPPSNDQQFHGARNTINVR